MDDIKMRVAAGLRCMKVTPDAFLFCDGHSEWTWDETHILGIPVYHVESMKDYRWESSEADVLFIPIWRAEGRISNRNDFIDGYLGQKYEDELKENNGKS